MGTPLPVNLKEVFTATTFEESNVADNIKYY